MISPALLPQLIQAISRVIDENAEEVTSLDQAIGDGDHVTNLQRGLQALAAQCPQWVELDWSTALQKMGMVLMSNVGGASGSLYSTLFISMSKAAKDQTLTLATFAGIFAQGVTAMKQRGKSDVGEKTMLDVLIPVANYLADAVNANTPLVQVLIQVQTVAVAGMESTRDMLATKGRASFLAERSLGCIDAGAKTAQLMICSLAKTLIQSGEF